jgi:predicted metal-binding membrane protein
MWGVMMGAMMLPSLVPMLGRYRRRVCRGASGLGRQTLYVALAYFLVWTLLGAAVYPLGAALAAACMRWPTLASGVPAAVGATVLAAGLLQFTSWKSRQLACCRGAVDLGARVPATGAGAWCHGLHLGLHCAGCCGGLMLILLVMGVMDLLAMAVVTAAITVERLAPAGEGAARAVGAAAVVAGLYLMLP